MTLRTRRALSLGLRVAALGSRFLLFFWLAFYLPPKDVGLYGLVAATVSYASLFIGMDFYLYANREFKQASEKRKFFILRRSLKVYASIYLLVLPCLTLIFIAGLLPWDLGVLFFMILILEHMGQEAYRLLVMMERVLLASWVLFLRYGLWPIVFASLMFVSPAFHTLEMLLIAWCIGAFLSICFAIKPLLALPRSPRSKSPSRDWVVRGLKVALPFLIGTLSLRGMVTIDRYFIEMFASREILGVYVFFAGMAATLPTLLEAGVFAFISPKLISAAKADNTEDFLHLFRKLFRETVGVVLAFIIISIGAIQLIIPYLPNQVYQDNIIIFYLCLAAQLPLSLSMVYHFSLYARRQDRLIIFSHVLGFVVFVVSALLVSNFWTVGAVPIALIVANSTMLVTKFIACLRFQKE